MPSKPLKPCMYPGCPELVTSGYCVKHQLQHVYNRDPEKGRLYSSAWKKRRIKQLEKQPWCEICLANGIYEPATDVHHVIPHRGNKKVFLTSPLQSLCHACHSRITATEGRGGEKVSGKGMASVGVQPREKISQCGESS